MTDKERAAMQQALEALENERSHMTANWDNIVKAITALREALAEPDMNLSCKSVQARLATSWGYVKADQAEQEPVAWIDNKTWCFTYSQYEYEDLDDDMKDDLVPLYAAPVRTKDLTDDEITKLYEHLDWGFCTYIDFARAVIAADRELNKCQH